MTAWRIARRFPITGFVRNLPDRTVELLAVGDAGPVQEFLDAVAAAMKHGIERTTEAPGPQEYSSRSFEIAD